jgi:hypothetical protein
MSDPQPTDTTQSNPQDNTKLAEAVASLAASVAQMRAAGDTAGEARIAQQAGLTPDQLTKLIDTAQAEGRGSEGIVQAIGQAMGAAHGMSAEREGKREVANLENSRKFGEAYSEHQQGFKKFIQSKQIPYAALADPGLAAETFDYYLKTQTDWDAKQKQKELDQVRADERKKVETELSTRQSTPAGPALPSGGAREGGVLSRLVQNATVTELNATQVEVARKLGLSDKDLENSSKAYARRTAFGVPLDDFVKTRNDGAID